MIRANNYETVSKFVKVMTKILWPLFFIRTLCISAGTVRLYLCPRRSGAKIKANSASRPLLVYSLYNFYGAPMTRRKFYNGRFLAEIFQVQKFAKIARF